MFLPLFRLLLAILFLTIVHFSYLLEQKGWSHLPFQGFRFQTEGSSAVVAFQLNCVGRSGQRQLSVCGCLQSSVLGKIKKNMTLQHMQHVLCASIRSQYVNVVAPVLKKHSTINWKKLLKSSLFCLL